MAKRTKQRTQRVISLRAAVHEDRARAASQRAGKVPRGEQLAIADVLEHEPRQLPIPFGGIPHRRPPASEDD